MKKVFDSLDKLNANFKRHHERVHKNKKKISKCNVCAQNCRTRHLRDHMRTHTDERPFKCRVSGCLTAFNRKGNLKRHNMFKHSDERPLKCDFQGCIFTTKTTWELNKHKKVHSDERPFACSHSGCNFRAKRKDVLTQHTATVHNDSKSFTCSKCNFNTNLASSLVRHRIVHDGRNEKILCSIEGCEYKGKHSKALYRHMLRHKTLLPCPVSGCGHYVTTKEALKDHIKLHNPSGRPFQCPFCYKHFGRLNMLQNHCFVHTIEKPFECGHCEYAAATRPNVKNHISARHANLEFPFIVHLLNDRECLRCKVILPSAEFLDHCKGHVVQDVLT